MSLYSKEIHQIIKSEPKQVKFTLDTVEHENRLELRVYENDVMRFDADDRNAIMLYLLILRSKIEKHGVVVWINGVHGDPPNRV